MKVEKRSEALDLWKKLTWKGPEVGGGVQAPIALDRTFLLDRSTLRYGLGPVARAMHQVGTGPNEKTMATSDLFPCLGYCYFKKGTPNFLNPHLFF